MTDTPETFKLPDTGVVYDPSKRHRRMVFTRALRDNAEAREVMYWFLGFGPYAPAADGTPHPAYMPTGTLPFIDSVRNGYVEWGTLTDRQLVAVQRVYTQVVEAVTAPAQAAALRRSTVYAGAMGERLRMQLIVEKVIPLKDNKHINKMRDTAGNCIVCIGGLALSEGGHLLVKATVSGNVEHKGEAQTHITDMRIINNRRPRRVHNATRND